MKLETKKEQFHNRFLVEKLLSASHEFTVDGYSDTGRLFKAAAERIIELEKKLDNYDKIRQWVNRANEQTHYMK